MKPKFTQKSALELLILLAHTKMTHLMTITKSPTKQTFENLALVYFDETKLAITEIAWSLIIANLVQLLYFVQRT